MARALDCVIVTVEYRLAPETPFPGSLEDNYAALKWLHAEAESLGVDPARIAVAGESAGGGHAAILAIAARDRGEIPVIFQSLVYPMLDDRTGSSRQPPPYIGTFIWTADYNRRGWKAFLATEPGGPRVPAGAVPARVDNLAGLPPAWIGTGSIDLFVNEDIEYARRLVDAGVRTDLLVVAGAYHGFDGLVPNASVSKSFTLSRYNALARAFGVKELDSAPSG
jgi:acetyl esterase/lipase